MHKKFVISNKKKHTFANWSKRLRNSRLATLHPALVPIVTFIVLLLVTLGGYVLFTGNRVRATDSRIVIISHDHTKQTVPTREPNVGALLNKLNIKLEKGDVVEPSLDTAINQDDFRINIYRAVPVRVIDGDKSIYTFSAATTPRSIARQTGLAVYAEDDLDTSPTTNFLKDGAIGQRVVIQRSLPVDVNLYGNQVAMRTRAQTVGDLLKEKGITLAKGDTVNPVASTPITKVKQIYIAQKGTKFAVKSEEIPMPVKRISDPNLAYGTSAVRQQGSPGRKVTTFKIILKNGREVGRVAVQTVVVQKPVQQVLVVGTNLGGIKGDMALAGISPDDYTYVDYIITHESHWNPAALNASGCAGLGQACPGSKLAAACPNWQSDPVCQLRFFSAYANSSHGGWYGAYQFKVSHGWW